MPSDFISKPPYSVVQPGAYSAVNASLLANPNLLNGRPIPMVLGPSLGGQPDTPLYFTDPGHLQQVLKGGVGYDVARFVFDGGAPTVGFCRVGNSPTQGTLPLAGSGGTVLTLTSQDWGSWVNSIQITVATGPIITLQYTDALGNVFTETWNFTGVGSLTVAQIVGAINGTGTLIGYNASNYVTATAGAGTLPLAVVSATPLTGGTDGSAPAAGDWTTGLSAIETEVVDLVLVATSTNTVHAQALTHCQNMSTPQARRERVLICGGALGESVAATVTRQQGLASARDQLVYPGMYDYNAAGVLTLYDPFYVAGKVAGMHCALPDPATSLVHELIPLIKAEVNLSTMPGGAIDQLLQANVTPIAPAPQGGYWVVDSLTGYPGSDKTFHDITKTRSADFVAQYARASLETEFVGGKSLKSTNAAVQTSATTIMTQLQNMGIIQAFNPAIVDNGPVVGSISVSLPVMLIDTDKFIFIQVALQPSSVTQSSTTANDLT